MLILNIMLMHTTRFRSVISMLLLGRTRNEALGDLPPKASRADLMHRHASRRTRNNSSDRTNHRQTIFCADPLGVITLSGTCWFRCSAARQTDRIALGNVSTPVRVHTHGSAENGGEEEHEQEAASSAAPFYDWSGSRPSSCCLRCWRLHDTARSHDSDCSSKPKHIYLLRVSLGCEHMSCRKMQNKQTSCRWQSSRQDAYRHDVKLLW